MDDILKKYRKRAAITGLISAILICFLWIFLVILIKKYEEQIDGPIGTYVIYQNDTLQVINHSILNSSYTLSNGIEVDASLLDDFEVVSKSNSK